MPEDGTASKYILTFLNVSAATAQTWWKQLIEAFAPLYLIRGKSHY